MNLPQHVAIIMDGNGRWGIKKKNSRNYGHSQGVKVIQKIIEACIKKKIKYLTLYTFSTENWKRPKSEIFFLFKLIEHYIDINLKKIIKKNIKLKIIGKIDKFPKIIISKIKKAEKNTKLNDKIQVNIALNYGARQEIILAIKKLYKSKLGVNIVNFEKFLNTKHIPDPDILIRTGNRLRLSNFLLWQLSYSEIFFVKKLWPDFNKNDLYKILNSYKKIKRNFGGL